MSNLEFTGRTTILDSLDTGNTVTNMVIGMILCSALTGLICLLSHAKQFMNTRKVEYCTHPRDLSINSDTFIEYTFDGTPDYFRFYQYPFSTTKTLDNVFFKQKDELVKKLNFFINNKNWYKRTGKPYTFGVMLYGPSGCGKTSFIKAILKSTNRCGVKIDLSDDVNISLLQNTIMSDNVGTRYLPHNRRILIFENIECMGDSVKSREFKNDENNNIEKIKQKVIKKQIIKNVKEGEDITVKTTANIDKNNNLSKLLNIFDGPIETSDRICIFTTNHIDYLDKALIRPGRVDCLIRFTKCTKQMIVDIMNLFYDSNDITLEHVKKYVDESISPAEIDSICFKNENKWKALEEILHISANIKLGDNINIYSVNFENKSSTAKTAVNYESDPESPTESDAESDAESDVESDAESDVESDAESDVESDAESSCDHGMDLINDAINTMNNYKRRST